MLHILWLMIKFILIVLGILLGVLLLALLLILFCPVRYRAEVRKDQPDWRLTEGEAGVSWLFHGISLKVRREKGETGFSVKLFGISLDKFLNKKDDEPKTEKKPKKQKTTKRRPKAEEPEMISETSAADSEQESPEQVAFGSVSKKNEEAENSISDNTAAETAYTADITDLTAEQETSENTNTAEEADSSDTAEEKIGLFTRISDKLKEIRSKISNIGLTFHKIHDKIEWWKKFIHHPRTQEALSLVWKHGKFLIRHILPTKVEGNITFGFENPANTGKLLGLLGMTIPFYKNRIAVNPLFDGENVVEGKVRLKGRIYGFVLLRAAITIYFNKNVKYVINRIRHRNHKEG